MPMGFIELTTVEGGALWLVVGSIYAIEKPPRDIGNWAAIPPTLVKTASELFVVAETAERVLEIIEESYMESEDEGFTGDNREAYTAAFGDPGFREAPRDDNE